MNVQKAEIKIALAKEMGAQYASMIEAAEGEALKFEGAREALKQAAKRVGELGAHVDKDLEEGVLSASDLKDPKQVEIYIKKYIKRMWGVLDNLATEAEVARHRFTGKVKGLEAASEHARIMCETEQKKVQGLLAQLESGEITVEDVEEGNHPGLPMRYQREDEAAAEAAEAAPAKPKKAKSKKKAKPKKAAPKKKAVPKQD